MGIFKSIAQLNISNGLTLVDIKLHGESKPPEGKKTLVGGIDKSARETEKVFKFVDPSAVLLEKMMSERMEDTVERESHSLTSQDRDRVYGMNR